MTFHLHYDVQRKFDNPTKMLCARIKTLIYKLAGNCLPLCLSKPWGKACPVWICWRSVPLWENGKKSVDLIIQTQRTPN